MSSRQDRLFCRKKQTDSSSDILLYFFFPLFHSWFIPKLVNAFTEKAEFDTVFSDEKPAPFLVYLSESFAGLADCKAEFSVSFEKAQQSAGMLVYFGFHT